MTAPMTQTFTMGVEAGKITIPHPLDAPAVRCFRLMNAQCVECGHREWEGDICGNCGTER